MARFIILNEKDNVAVAVEPAKAGDSAVLSDGKKLKVNQEVPFAHKIAVKAMKKGEKVIKYGEVIGEASKDIVAGDHVHIQNIRSLRG
ncbi:MAG: UxaA family hydrolase [Deltaproteobacteria bacterium]|nr:UxaA family hydrolase [Deltaproteobacteria bacterium]